MKLRPAKKRKSKQNRYEFFQDQQKFLSFLLPKSNWFAVVVNLGESPVSSNRETRMLKKSIILSLAMGASFANAYDPCKGESTNDMYQCAAQAAEEHGGGTFEKVARMGCLVRVTKSRSTYLLELYQDLLRRGDCPSGEGLPEE